MSRRPADRLLACVLVACIGAACTAAAWARTSDRSQPMDAESNQNTCTMGDAGQCELTGDVRITQGTLHIQADRAVIYRAGGDISRATFSGRPVVLEQQMDDGTRMTARANGIDYNLKSEVVVFTGDVRIEQPRGSMSGQRVVYNLKTGSVDSGGKGNGRVKMRILPSNPQAAPAAAAEDAGSGQDASGQATPDQTTSEQATPEQAAPDKDGD